MKTNTRLPMSRDLESIVRENIDLRTAGRMRRLHVSRVGNEVIVRGDAPSYYIKQLALASVLKTLGPLGSVRIVHDIRVRSSSVPGFGAGLDY